MQPLVRQMLITIAVPASTVAGRQLEGAWVSVLRCVISNHLQLQQPQKRKMFMTIATPTVADRQRGGHESLCCIVLSLTCCSLRTGRC